MKRFWARAEAVPHHDGWAVALDGKTALTPARSVLATPHPRLAECVAAEWAAAPDVLRPDDMPMTGYLNAVIDRVGPHHQALAADLARFVEADPVCYRAEGPAVLAARQAAGWDPVVAWITQRYGARLSCGVGVTPIPQSTEALSRLRSAIGSLDPYRLTAVLSLSSITKSLALTLSVVEGALSAAQAYDLSRIDEDFQAEQWGIDAEAARRVDRERKDIAAAARFLAALD